MKEKSFFQCEFSFGRNEWAHPGCIRILCCRKKAIKKIFMERKFIWKLIVPSLYKCHVTATVGVDIKWMPQPHMVQWIWTRGWILWRKSVVEMWMNRQCESVFYCTYRAIHRLPSVFIWLGRLCGTHKCYSVSIGKSTTFKLNRMKIEWRLFVAAHSITFNINTVVVKDSRSWRRENERERERDVWLPIATTRKLSFVAWLQLWTKITLQVCRFWHRKPPHFKLPRES